MTQPTAPTSDSAKESNSAEIVRNLVAGLTVSFVAISLGAAFGELSGRGATAGILSAGLIAFITALFGGTRIQCSGPTAPMTAITVTLVAFAVATHDGLNDVIPGANPDHFINVVLIMTGALIALIGLLRLGKFISYVPHVVISGFMNGIAILIWLGESKKLLGVPKEPKEGSTAFLGIGDAVLAGGLPLNIGIAVVTLVLCFTLPKMLKRLGAIGHYLPGTLVAIIAMTAVVSLVFPEAARVKMGASEGSLIAHIEAQIPRDWSFAILAAALPFALSLTLLAYLDTLLTALVVDKLVQEDLGLEETTAQNKELGAQGLANAAAGLIGGIPGAQATIRSVLILKEGATMRIAGVAVGLFVIIEMLALQEMIALIPSAVFSGILIKVGYDVMDWPPLRVSFRKLFGKPPAEGTLLKHVAPIDLFFILGTTIVTILINLNVAVISFLVLFYAFRRVGIRVPDLQQPPPLIGETEGKEPSVEAPEPQHVS